MKTVFPESLNPGDRVWLIDPANAYRQPGLNSFLSGFADTGLDIRVAPDMAFKHGTPQQRAAILNGLLADPENRGFFCLWGGYGSMTLLEHLDYDALTRNRPAFVGFSDITALHQAIEQKTGLVTFHSRVTVGEEPLPDRNRKQLLERLQFPELTEAVTNLDGTAPTVIRPGDAAGKLTGGNMTLISRLMGTPYEIDTRGKILFLEEVGEKPYRLHGMLTQLRLAGKLSSAAGIVLGPMVSCDTPNAPGSAMEAVLDVLSQTDVPIMGNLRAGHIPDALTLPLGKPCSISGGKLYL